MKGELEEEQWLVCAWVAQSDRGPGNCAHSVLTPGLSSTTSTSPPLMDTGPEGPGAHTHARTPSVCPLACDAVAESREGGRKEGGSGGELAEGRQSLFCLAQYNSEWSALKCHSGLICVCVCSCVV